MNTYAEALRLYQDGQYEEAAQRLRIIVEFDRQNHQALMYYGAALGQLGRWSQAVDAYRAVTNLLPEDPTAYCELATALIELGHWDQAEDAVTTALLLESSHPVALGLRERIRSHYPQRPDTDEPQATPPPPTLAPAPVPPRFRRVHVLSAVLALLLLVVLVRALRNPGERWRRLAEAERLLDQIDKEHRRLAGAPGEDFDSMSRIRALRDGAEARVLAVARSAPNLPEVHLLRARLAWERDRDGFGAKNAALEALAQLRANPGERRRPSGRTPAQLQARAYRLMAEVDLAAANAGRGAEALQRARGWAERARQLDANAIDADFEAALQRAGTGRR